MDPWMDIRCWGNVSPGIEREGRLGFINLVTKFRYRADGPLADGKHLPTVTPDVVGTLNQAVAKVLLEILFDLLPYV